ncbi:MAG: PAS domain S-box protein [bacterium]|nr:PAS domain S-box protein [bacterium]
MTKPTYDELEKRVNEFEKAENASKHREQLLFENSEWRRIVIEQSRDGIVVLDQECKVYETNQRFADMLGYSEAEVLSLHVWDWDTQWTPAELKEIINKVDESGDFFETKHRRKDGTIYDVEISTNAIINGEYKLIFCVCRDITKRKKAEKTLQEREKLFRMLMDSTSDGYFDHNLITDEVYYGERCEEMLGYAPGEIKHHLSSWQSLLHPEDIPGIEEEVKSLVEGKIERFVQEYRIRNKTEDWQWLLSRAKIVEWDENGKPTRLVGTHQVITKRKKAEQELRKNEFFLQESQRVSKLGSYVYDIVNDSMSWTETLNNIFGIRDNKKKDINRWISTLNKEDRPIMSDYFIKEVIGKGKTFDKEYRIINQETGKIVWVHGLGELEYNENNDPIKMIGTIQDITERKKADEALVEERNTLLSLINTIPNPIYFKDKECKFITCNEATLEVLMCASGRKNLTLSEVIGKTDHDFSSKETADGFREKEERIIQTNKPQINLEVANKDKTQFGLITKVPFVDSKGNTIGLVCINNNITERKKAEEALKESEEKFKMLAEQSLMGTHIIQDGLFKYINEASAELMGLPREEILRWKPNEFGKVIHPDDLPFVMEQYRKKQSGDKVVAHNYQWRLVNSAGEIKWIESYSKTIQYLGRNADFVNMIDITERKKAESALRESEEKFRAVIDQAGDGISLVDRQGIVREWNMSQEKITGIKQIDAVGKPIWELIARVYPGDKDPSVLRQLMKGLKISFAKGNLQKYDKSIVNEFQLPDGTKRFVEKYGFPVTIGENKMYANFHRDITERIQLEEQLQIRQRMDSLGTLAGGIAHDFNNILVGIMGNIDLLLFDRDDLSESQKEYLEGAEKSCERARELIQQFHSFSKASLTEKTSVDVYEIAKEVTSLLENTTDKLIKKKIGFKKGEYFVKANPTELNQVLVNLGINSAQAIVQKSVNPGDYISINAEEYKAESMDVLGLRDGDYIHIIFEDNGIGMSEEVMRKAFDPLFTTKDKGGARGQGLGLAMVFNLVTRVHRGHISIESEEGRGTTFHIYLPKAQHEETAIESRMLDVSGGDETILVVDDEETVRKLAETMLITFGYKVLTAVDGKQALDKYQEQKDSIDAVILDLTMPMLSGEMVLRGMLEINPDIKVIISSGHSEEFAREGILSKAKGNIDKPYKMKDLAETVRTVLDS